MKTRKLLAVILALCMMLGIFASCGSGDTVEPQEECEHSWKKATCETPKTCSKCSETKGDAKGHTWVDATCQKPKTCSSCDKEEGAALPDHKYEDGKCIYCEILNPKDLEFASAQDAYTALAESQDLSTEFLKSIYGAWYFYVYEDTSDYSSYYDFIDEYCDQTNLEYDDVIEVIDDTLYTVMGNTNPTMMERAVLLKVLDLNINVVYEVYNRAGVITKLDENLEAAKNSIKNLTSDYADYTGYETLKLYYSEISSCVEFCKSPTGTFGDLSTVQSTYETNFRTYKNELSLIFD